VRRTNSHEYISKELEEQAPIPRRKKGPTRCDRLRLSASAVRAVALIVDLYPLAMLGVLRTPFKALAGATESLIMTAIAFSTSISRS
jgi:hypothetical protein